VVREQIVDDEIEETKIGTLPPGACFGEQALIFNEPRSASVKASTYTSVMTLSKACFEESATAFPELRKRLHELIEKRNQRRQEAAAKWSGATIGVMAKRDYSASELVLALRGSSVFPRLQDLVKTVGLTQWETMSKDEKRQAVINSQALVMERAQSLGCEGIVGAGTVPKLTSSEVLAKVMEQLAQLTVEVQLLSQEQASISGEIAAVHRRVAMQTPMRTVG
jgi:CRP-like cAMP-binding protein